MFLIRPCVTALESEQNCIVYYSIRYNDFLLEIFSDICLSKNKNPVFDRNALYLHEHTVQSASMDKDHKPPSHCSDYSGA